MDLNIITDTLIALLKDFPSGDRSTFVKTSRLNRLPETIAAGDIPAFFPVTATDPSSEPITFGNPPSYEEKGRLAVYFIQSTFDAESAGENVTKMQDVMERFTNLIQRNASLSGTVALCTVGGARTGYVTIGGVKYRGFIIFLDLLNYTEGS